MSISGEKNARKKGAAADLYFDEQAYVCQHRNHNPTGWEGEPKSLNLIYLKKSWKRGALRPLRNAK